METAVRAGYNVQVTEIAAQLMAHAQSALTHDGLTIDPTGLTELQNLFNMSADRMVAEHRVSSNDLGEAHHAVALLAQAIVRQTRLSNTTYVNANIIQKVRDFFCPPGLWPFC